MAGVTKDDVIAVLRDFNANRDMTKTQSLEGLEEIIGEAETMKDALESEISSETEGLDLGTVDEQENDWQ